MTNKDPDDSEETAVRQEHVESEEDPWKVHRLESRSEPEAHDDFFVELTPDVKNWEHHRIHQKLKYNKVIEAFK